MRGIAARTVMMAPRDDSLTATMGKTVCCSYLAWYLTPPSGANDDILAGDRVITTDAPFEVQTEKLFTIGEGDTVAAMELALRHSQAGDVLFLRAASKFAYSAAGRPGAAATRSAVAEGAENALLSPASTASRTFDYAEAQAKLDTYTAAVPAAGPPATVPPYTDLEYVIRVLGVYDDPVAALRRASPEYDQHCRARDCERAGERVVAEMLIRKQAGNGWFSAGDFARAGKCYAKAIQIAEVYQSQLADQDAAAAEAGGGEEVAPAQDDGREEVAAALLTALNNLSACYLSRGDHTKAKEVCVRVLEADSTNTKALLRAARASLALHEYDEAELCVKRALEITTEAAKTDPDADPQKIAAFYGMEMAKVEKARREYKVREKEMAMAMASRLFKKPAAAAAAVPAKPGTSSSSQGDNSADTASMSSGSLSSAGAAPTAAAAAAEAATEAAAGAGGQQGSGGALMGLDMVAQGLPDTSRRRTWRNGKGVGAPGCERTQRARAVSTGASTDTWPRRGRYQCMGEKVGAPGRGRWTLLPGASTDTCPLGGKYRCMGERGRRSKA